MHSPSDQHWIRAILKRGDERAFRLLYRRHTPRLLQFILRLVGGDELEAENLTQETWIRASDSLSRFRGDSLFATWLTGIGLNVTRDHLRRRSRLPLDAIQSPDIVSAPIPIGDGIDLERAIARLPDGYRMVLVLHDIEGMKHAEIAERLGFSEGTSKSQLFKARRLLRGSLTESREIKHARE